MGGTCETAFSMTYGHATSRSEAGTKRLPWFSDQNKHCMKKELTRVAFYFVPSTLDLESQTNIKQN